MHYTTSNRYEYLSITHKFKCFEYNGHALDNLKEINLKNIILPASNSNTTVMRNRKCVENMRNAKI